MIHIVCFLKPGLVFLLQQPELSATVVHALRGSDDVNKDACVPLRYASVLIAKGFFCGPREVGMIIGMHLRVVSYFVLVKPINAWSSSNFFLQVFSFEIGS